MPVPEREHGDVVEAAGDPEPPLGDHRTRCVVVDHHRHAPAARRTLDDADAVQRQVHAADRLPAGAGPAARARRRPPGGRGPGPCTTSCTTSSSARRAGGRRSIAASVPRARAPRLDHPREQLRPSEVQAERGPTVGPYSRPRHAGGPRLQGLPLPARPSGATSPTGCRSCVTRRPTPRGGPGSKPEYTSKHSRRGFSRAGRSAAAASPSGSLRPIAGWILLSLVLFMVSAFIQRKNTSDAARSALSSTGYTLDLGQHDPRARLRRAPAGQPRSRARTSAAPRARTRSCSSARAAGSRPSSPSRATRSSTSPATARTRSTPRTPSAARA